MQAFEFETIPSPDGSLPVPAAVVRRLHDGQPVRVIVMLEDESADWAEPTAREFLRGYASEDAIYDDLDLRKDRR